MFDIDEPWMAEYSRVILDKETHLSEQFIKDIKILYLDNLKLQLHEYHCEYTEAALEAKIENELLISLFGVEMFKDTYDNFKKEWLESL